MQVKPARCDVCKKHIVLGQQIVTVWFLDSDSKITILPIVHRLKCLPLVEEMEKK